jgi:hypothetical protein
MLIPPHRAVEEKEEKEKDIQQAPCLVQVLNKPPAWLVSCDPIKTWTNGVSTTA